MYIHVMMVTFGPLDLDYYSTPASCVEYIAASGNKARTILFVLSYSDVKIL